MLRNSASNSYRQKLFLISFFITFLLFSCKTTSTVTGGINTQNPTENFNNEEIPALIANDLLCPPCLHWEEIIPQSQSLLLTKHTIPGKNITWNCVKIDLQSEDIDLQITLSPLFESQLHETSSSNIPASSVESFARKTNAIIAVNTTPFEKKGTKYNLLGINKQRGQSKTQSKDKNNLLTNEFASCYPQYSALVLNKIPEGYYGNILVSQDPELIKDWDYAIGGFFTILKDSEILPFKRTRRPRTGCGLSADGRYLYIMTAVPQKSLSTRNGLFYEECALIFKTLGCTNAMQFDGGHSTALVVNKKTVSAPLFHVKVPAALSFSKNNID